VPNGVNAKHFSQQYTEAEIKEVQEKLGKKEGDVFMITTSRLVKKNAVDDVIKAMKFLPEHVYFLVYGIGPDEEMLKALAKSEGVEKRVRFMGQLSHADMPKYLKACDIFIRPSLSEGFGISFIEAMVAEIPVIATQAGGIADYLFDSELNRDQMPTGYVVATRDPEGIARQVKRCLEDSALRVSVIKNAKTLAIERYDWDRIAKQMKEGVFDKLLK
jgi:glycosyltransferase involved in cell wall biosynthesis